MDIVYRLGRASAQQVLEKLALPPSYSAVRALLRLLKERGHVKHVEEGGRYCWLFCAPYGPAASLARRAQTEGAVRFSAEVESPVVVRAWRPVIVLADAARDWPEERLLAVMLHESAHVRRRDGLALLVANAGVRAGLVQSVNLVRGAPAAPRM